MAEISPLEMSDEQALNWVPEDVPTEEPEVTESDSDSVTDEVEETENTSDDDSTEEDDSDSEESLDDAVEEDVDDEPSEDTEQEESTEEVESEGSDSSDNEESPEINYKEQYEKLLAPFKANGKEMRVDSVEDAVQLMQMGANYSKKMAALKPNLKLMKMLDNNSLLSEDKLSFAIDVLKGDKSAVKKLLADHSIDTYELEESADYKPNSYTVDDRELELDSAIEDIRGTDKFRETIELVSTKWDSSSRKAFAEHPQLIKVINEHMQNGVYDQISQQVDRDRMLGRLDGLSDLQAYHSVGERLFKEGKFDDTPKDSVQVNNQVNVKPKSKATDTKTKDRKRKASKPRSSKQSSTELTDLNPLSLSDEEFEKQYSGKYL